MGLTLFLLAPGAVAQVSGHANSALQTDETTRAPLAPSWKPSIQRWSNLIAAVAADSGLDADLIAAVINAESDGIPDGISRMGAVGLMGVMPSGPGMEWRPTTEQLLDPEVNLNWGVAILADVIQQSGGDLTAALAAYAGGWDQASLRVPQEYAAAVLDDYARAVVTRAGHDPAIAAQWTIAVTLEWGHVPFEPLLLGREPLGELQTYGEHLVYRHVDRTGRPFIIRGYAVPVAMVVELPAGEPAGTGWIAPQLLARQGVLVMPKSKHDNPRILMACLPSLDRLRGRVSTRWFAPAGCPARRR